MLVKIEDLQVGDEIIISWYADLIYLKVLQSPKKNKQGHWKSVKCSTSKNTYTYPNGVSYSYKVFEADISLHNTEMYQDLNGRGIWLVKRNGKPVIE